MQKTRFLILLCSHLFLFGCAGVGIVATSDPLTKLNDARHLLNSQDRPLPAERLIREAMVIYQERGDLHGLGHAHRQYADFLRSRSVAVTWQNHYRSNGFLDKSVTFDNRTAKSSEHYSKALENYRLAEIKLREERKFDALTNLYVNMAYSFSQIYDRDKACFFYDKSSETHSENIKQNPDIKVIGDVPGLVRSEKKRLGCT